jgi:ABC-type antimicrobial peptide transport system permease subunit
MNTWRLVVRSLLFAWRQHVAVVLATACASTVLIGALVVGASTRSAVADLAAERIGSVRAALVARDRTFRAELADAMAARLRGATLAPVLWLGGAATAVGKPTYAADVQVLGVEDRFGALSPARVPFPLPPPGHALASAALLQRLGAAPGDEIVVRVGRADGPPRRCALAPVHKDAIVATLQVAGELSAAQFGRFDLAANAVAKSLVVVSLAWLQQCARVPGRANTLLLGAGADQADVAADPDAANDALRAECTLGDLGLVLGPSGDAIELTSARLLIEPPIAAALEKLAPTAVGAFTWFVNELRCAGRATPYSMVTALGPLAASAHSPPLPALADLRQLAPRRDDQIVLNDWSAHDLGAGVGDAVTLSFFALDPKLDLVEREQTLRVDQVVPLAGAAADPSLLPPFPGVVEADSCRDFEPGVPIDLGRLRAQDEAYWRVHKGTPKAFVTLAAGQSMWRSPFGGLTAVRLPPDAASLVAAQLPRTVDPGSCGLRFVDVRQPARAASVPASDLGGLFLGVGSLLVLAALLLVLLMFHLSVGARAAQIGTLLALGFTAPRVRWLLLREGGLLVLCGSALGIAPAALYAHVVLRWLQVLPGDVAAAELRLRVTATSVVLGASVTIVTAMVAIACAVRHATRRAPAALLRGDPGAQRLAVSARRPVRGRAEFVWRNLARHRGRNQATLVLLALATFAVVAAHTLRLPPPSAAASRHSGTGGFALYAETTRAIERNLDTARGRAAYGLSADDLADVALVSLQVRDGDELSCHQLGSVSAPRLLGVEPDALAARDAFAVVATLAPPAPRGDLPANAWHLLHADYGPGIVPAFADADSITWLLHKKLGDDIVYRDDAGAEVRVRLVGALAQSILQGALLIAHDRFAARFPSSVGARAFLIDAPSARARAVASRLEHAFRDHGCTAVLATDRLAALQQVQNTYLLAFQILGALALLLGCLGVSAVVARNVLERRHELALLTAIGFTASSVRRMLWCEHALVLGCGLFAGTAAGLLVGALVRGMASFWVSTTGAFALVAVIGLAGGLGVAAVARQALRGSPHAALRND